jgi:hypothetical protein
MSMSSKVFTVDHTGCVVSVTRCSNTMSLSSLQIRAAHALKVAGVKAEKIRSGNNHVG